MKMIQSISVQNTKFSMKLNISLAIVLWLAGLVSQANSDIPNSMELLANAQRIETSKIGEEGRVSVLAQGFREILARKSAKMDFRKLFDSATTEAARLYALTGLYILDKEEYHRLSNQLDMNKNVLGMLGDTYERKTVRGWLDMIENGQMLKGFTWEPMNPK